MKYIRTKDGIKKVHKINNDYLECDSVIGNNVHCYAMIHKNDVIKQGDTIEEVCDEFRGVLLNYYESAKQDAHEEFHYDKKNSIFFNSFEELTHKKAIELFDKFYGAIWTDKGLIYVAKMNVKGELELL